MGTRKHALNYQVEISSVLDDGEHSDWVVAKMSSKSKTMITDLIPGMYYQFRVKAFGRRDETPYSGVRTIMAA
jgi:hypothetical protein